jgi:hypothetical protein
MTEMTKSQAINQAIILTDSDTDNLYHFATLFAKCSMQGNDDALAALSVHDLLVPAE